MADRSRRHTRSDFVIGAVTIGAVTATVGITPAAAENAEYPTWQEVQQANQSTAAAAAEVRRITDLVVGLQDAADSAGRTSQIAAEHAHRAAIAEATAKAHLAALRAQVAAAEATAATSRMRAGLLAAHLARTGAGDISLDLALNAADADNLLYRLTTMSQLSEQAQAITSAAQADQNAAASLTAQADIAATDLTTASQVAAAASASAQDAAAKAGAAVATQQANADRLTDQLATLQHTSSALAAGYLQGVQERRDAAAEAAAAKAAAAATPTPSAQPAPTPGSPSDSPSSSTPDPSPSAPAPAPPAPPSGPVPQPNSAQAASAVAFARDQIGDRYAFGGAGPSSWDCSGLTMQSYASVGISIGGHSATAQYNLARSEGLLVPYSDVQVGDLIFYTDGGGDMYHVAIYSGGGEMIEAPYDGVPVREVSVRSYQRVSQVARFTG